MTTENTPSKIFAERLKSARDLRELSQGKLASRAKLPASSISHFEAGSRKPSFENLGRLANALKVSTDFLLGRVDDPEAHGSAADKLYRNVSNLSAEDAELAENFLKMLAERSKQNE